MKKLSLIISCSILSLLFFNCSDDDSNDDSSENVMDETNSSEIIGKWKLIQSFEDDMDEELEECLLNETLEFKADNVLINDSPFFSGGGNTCASEIVEGTYKIDDSMVDLIGLGLFYDSGTFSIENDQLTLTFIDDEDPDDIYTIREIYSKVE